MPPSCCCTARFRSLVLCELSRCLSGFISASAAGNVCIRDQLALARFAKMAAVAEARSSSSFAVRSSRSRSVFASRAAAREKLRLRLAEGDLRLLARSVISHVIGPE
jgi:hypothetical protein